MKFKFTKFFEDRPPDLVTPLLERCLKSEAWKVWRNEDSVLTLGIGTSRSIINLSDCAKFLVRPYKASTEVVVEVEYQGTRFPSADEQSAQVRSRLEEVFARVRAELDLQPEEEPSFTPESEEDSDVEIGEQATQKENPGNLDTAAVPIIPAVSAVPIPAVPIIPAVSAVPIPAVPAVPALSAASVATPSAQNPAVAGRSLRRKALSLGAESTVVIERLMVTINKSFAKPLPSPRFSIPRRPLAAAAVLILLIPCGIFWSLHSKANHLGRSTSAPLASGRRALAPLASPPPTSPPLTLPAPPATAPQETHAPTLEARTTAAPESTPGAGPKTSPSPVQVSPPSLPAPREPNVRLWLGAWAASERTRNANLQASFYAGQVSPYLNQSSASWAAVYRSKQAAIRERKGLWTFDIKDISFHQRDQDTVSVNLKKHFMAQAGSVLVSEELIPSQLTLRRVGGVWHITGERDLR